MERWKTMGKSLSRVNDPSDGADKRGAKTEPGRASGRVLIVGERRDSRRLARSLRRGPLPDLPVVGFVDAGHSGYTGPLSRGRQLAVHPQAEPVPVLGRIDRLAELVNRSKATHLVVSLSGRSKHRIRRQLEIISKSNVHVLWLTDEKTATDPEVNPAAWTIAHPGWPWRWDRAAKRMVDVLGSLFGLIVFSPLFFVVGLAILITSGRPILYTQERVGRGGRLFRMFKFRSMRPDAEGNTGPIWASNRDDRCTPIGAWLRRTNIDELPQLINVLRGEMSLVGPRPERPVFVERFRETVPDYDLRHAMPGGMTGWAQVHGWRGRTSLRKRVQYDLDYIQRWTFLLDFRVLLMTFEHVVFGRTSWNGGGRTPGRPPA
jgi:exopolysaccharide biosynthesis polyprenyl glycosylphosphotransferase